MKQAVVFDAFLKKRFNWSALAPEILEHSEWGPTVVHSSVDPDADGLESSASQQAGGMAVEKVGGDADHEARVAAAFGGLELGGTEQLAAAARQSRLARIASMELERGQGQGRADGSDGDSLGGTATTLGEGTDALTSPSTRDGIARHDGFEDAFLQMGGRAEDIPTSPLDTDGGLPPTEGLNTSWESPTAAEFRIRRTGLSNLIGFLSSLSLLTQVRAPYAVAAAAAGEKMAKAEVERAEAAAEAAEREVETDVGTETETGTESEFDTDTDEAGSADRRRVRRGPELPQRMDAVDEDPMADDTEEQQEESEEILAASAAEDALYRVADEATRATPAPPSHGQWAVESLEGSEGLSGYRERQLQANALRDALAAAKNAKAAQASA